MPQATIDPNETKKCELKSLEGAYVVLRVMSYDAWLQRQDMVTQVKMSSAGRGKQQQEAEVNMMNRRVTQFEFKECIVDHNLTNGDDQELDLTKSSTLKLLHPKVGQEIGDLIDDMNSFLLDEEAQGN